MRIYFNSIYYVSASKKIYTFFSAAASAPLPPAPGPLLVPGGGRASVKKFYDARTACQHPSISLHLNNKTLQIRIQGIISYTNNLLIIRSMSTLKYDRSASLVQVNYLVEYPINPISDSLLFSPKYTGSLYSIISLKVLEILNPKSSSFALIPIIEVIDLALDPSGVSRKYKNKTIVYLWTNKNTGYQYVGSTLNAGDRFGRTYNSSSYLKSNNSPFNKAILLHGHSSFYVTILEVLPRSKEIVWPIETLWRAILNPYYNRARISGSLSGIIRKDIDGPREYNNLGELLGKARIGADNPFYGKSHSAETRKKNE